MGLIEVKLDKNFGFFSHFSACLLLKPRKKV